MSDGKRVYLVFYIYFLHWHFLGMFLPFLWCDDGSDGPTGPGQNTKYYKANHLISVYLS